MSTNEQLLAQSAIELRRRIGSKEVSPVELIEACIERIERINPAVNAVTATCYDRAREEARAAEKAALRGEPLGLLHGLPAGIKDLEETAGLLTTFGSPLYRDFVPERDNAMVARVRAAGAIVVGKTNVPEISRFRGDRALLGAAHAMEQAFAAIAALRRPVPDLGKLTQPVPALKSIVTHPPKAAPPWRRAPFDRPRHAREIQPLLPRHERLDWLLRLPIPLMHLQSWDCHNLFVMGACVFPHNSAYNPTGPVGALAYRAADTLKNSYLKNPGPLVSA